MTMTAVFTLEQELDFLCDRLPQPFQSWLRALHGGSRWRRIPAGVGLVVGGFLSFLPVFGIWMLPLGLILLAKDVPPLRVPSARALAWVRRKFPARKPAEGRVAREARDA